MCYNGMGVGGAQYQVITDPKTPARFWAKVDKTHPDGCWLWTASQRNKGYGAFGYTDANGNVVNARAHVVSWELVNGPVPEGMCVLHNCPGGDKPGCVNPDHLWLGTKADNNRDKIVKGRQPHQYCMKDGSREAGNYKRGRKHWNFKFDETVLESMRRDRADGMSYSQLSRKHGVAMGHVWRILNGVARTIVREEHNAV